MHKLNVLLSKNGQQEAQGLSAQAVLSNAFINGDNKLTNLDRKRLKAVKEQIENMNESENFYIHNPDDVYALFKNDSYLTQQEHFNVLYLNTKYKVIHKETIFKGSLNTSVVHPREILNRALLASSCAIICVHNHPSGDPTPSDEDIQFTRRLNEGANLLGIDLLDHLIIGDDKYISMKEQDIF